MRFKYTPLFVIACALGGIGLAMSFNRLFLPTQQASVRDTGAFELLYHACIDGGWPTEADAPRRSEACSQALQSHRLQLSQVALARLTRGVARTMLGNKVASAGDYLEALKHYDSVIEPRNPDAIAVYRRAVAEHGLGQTAQALADYSTAIRLDPRNHLAYFGRGTLIASRERNYLRAIDDFNRGFVFLKLGEPAKAIKEYAAALEIDPNRQLALYGRALAYCHLGNTQECDRDKAAATAIAPDVAQQFARFGVS